MAAAPDANARLHELSAGYTWRVNAAVEEGRPDLADGLADDYLDDSLRTLTELVRP